MAIISTAGALLGKPLISLCATKITKSLLAVGSKNAAKIIAKLKVDSIAENYSQKVISRITTFKTLNGDGQDITLNDIYVPLSLENKKTMISIPITEGTTLKYDGCISITGSAGQGKTTIMRKLFVEEMIAGERFPFFITLRDCDYDNNKSCIDLLIQHLLDCGIECKPVDVQELLKSGRVVIYFDGFDEVVIEKRLKVLKLITDTHYIYSCPSITTTRPDTELSKSLKLESYNVNKLNSQMVKQIVKKTITDVSLAHSINATIENNTFLRETINTPILVSIFILTYSSFTDEPRALTDFYGVLFISLMYKHDKNKNFSRDKKTRLSNNRLEYCFSIFSYLSFMKGDNSFSELSLRKYFHEATTVLTSEDISELVMHDIVNGTNIVVMDGYDRFVYIHRSIQEFFTAKCIESFDEKNKEIFYKDVVMKEEKAKFFEQVLRMLSSIDDKNFARFYLLPILKRKKLLNDEGYVLKYKPSDFLVLSNNIKIGVTIDNGEYTLATMSNPGRGIPSGLPFLERTLRLISYSTLDHQSSIVYIIEKNINRFIEGYINNKGVGPEDYKKHYTSKVYSSNSPNVTFEPDDFIVKEDFLYMYFGGEYGSDYFQKELAGKVNEFLGSIDKYLDDNVYKYNQGNLAMIKMIQPLTK